MRIRTAPIIWSSPWLRRHSNNLRKSAYKNFFTSWIILRFRQKICLSPSQCLCIGKLYPSCKLSGHRLFLFIILSRKRTNVLQISVLFILTMLYFSITSWQQKFEADGARSYFISSFYIHEGFQDTPKKEPKKSRKGSERESRKKTSNTGTFVR